MSTKPRCAWVKDGTALEIEYHDMEWGVPVHDDQKLFEFLILEGAQAGLNWSTILKKRDHYRQAYDKFDPHKVALYDDVKCTELMQNSGIIRNRLKIMSSIKNARAFLKIRQEFGSFDRYIWRFTNYSPIQNNWQKSNEIPVMTDLSQSISKDLKKRGFSFVGPTICYAFMQAIGMVNDHLTCCYRHSQLY